MAESQHPHKKRLHSEQASEEIRTDELIKATQIEAKDHGQGTDEPLKNIPVTNNNYWRFKGEKNSTLPKGVKWGVIGLIVLFIGGSIISYHIVKKNITSTLSARVDTLQAGVQDLQNLDPKSAQAKFDSLNNAMSSPSGFFSAITSLFQGSSGAIQSFGDLSKQLALLTQDISNAENDLFSDNSSFVDDLKKIRTELGAIDADSNQLSSAANYLGNSTPLSGEGYLSIKTQIQGAEHFLDTFLLWLSDGSTHHVLILLENPSEMRPGGGFLGSYADVSIGNGSISDISVHDIADVDKAFTDKIVPPSPLQLEGTSWRPADGNWFFDFPTSASETILLFERSKLYSASSSTFDGAIAITPQVMQDVLSITGPLTVESTTFTSNNLVIQVQKIVQAGQAKSAGAAQSTYPKAILGELWKSMFGALASSTDTQKSQLLELMTNWIANKDAMAYFKRSELQSFVDQYGATGNVYQLPQNVNGDYLAVVNADINSDKSELYINETVNYDGVINADGTLSDHVDITRTHTGDQSSYWWYKTTNQDYMQLFVPTGVALTNQSGGIAKTVPAPVNYGKQGYSTDTILFAIQSSTQPNFTFPKVTTHEESGKEVFSIWSRVFAGASTEISVDYSRHLLALPADGVQYQFVFEKQSGAEQHDKFEIDAPLGYVFAENQLASFMYDSTSSPGSMIVNLTLQKLQ